MINIRIQVFSKDDQLGAHMETDSFCDKPDQEAILAIQLIEAVKDCLKERASKSKHSRTLECSGDSQINKDLRKEFGLDEDTR